MPMFCILAENAYLCDINPKGWDIIGFSRQQRDIQSFFMM